jgi:hypothetical protein
VSRSLPVSGDIESAVLGSALRSRDGGLLRGRFEGGFVVNG